MLKTCDGVTAAYMVLGLTASSGGGAGDAWSRDRVYMLVQEFPHRFKKRWETTSCRELLATSGIEINTPGQMKNLRQDGPCVEMVKETVRILDDVCDGEF